MRLTEDWKAKIDRMTYDELLSRWRFAAIGDPLFQGESGEYFAKRMAEARKFGVDTVAASKRVGWEANHD